MSDHLKVIEERIGRLELDRSLTEARLDEARLLRRLLAEPSVLLPAPGLLRYPSVPVEVGRLQVIEDDGDPGLVEQSAPVAARSAHPGEATTQKPARAKRKPTPPDSPGGKIGRTWEEKRRLVAAHLALHGPTTRSKLVHARAMAGSDYDRVISDPWFRLEGTKLHLTPAGQLGLSGSSAVPPAPEPAPAPPAPTPAPAVEPVVKPGLPATGPVGAWRVQRVKVARFIRTNGPTVFKRVAECCGMDEIKLRESVRGDDWFEAVAGRLDLTSDGYAAMRAEKESA